MSISKKDFIALADYIRGWNITQSSPLQDAFTDKPFTAAQLNTWQNFAWPRIQTSTVSAGWTMLLATGVRMGVRDDSRLLARRNRDSAHHQTEVIPWRIPKRI